MRPDLPPDACWTSLVGAPTHSLGELPEKCFTCAAKWRETIGEAAVSGQRAYEAVRVTRNQVVSDMLRRQAEGS